jgi:Protein of unknown function (DUF1566)
MPNSQPDVTAGAPNLEAYRDNGDGTVTDTVTGLMWQRAFPTTKYTLAEAISYCQTLPLGGHGDWRVPSRIELASLVDTAQAGATINLTYFPGTTTDPFWSSTLAVGSSIVAWTVAIGYTGYTDVTLPNSVRCVR